MSLWTPYAEETALDLSMPIKKEPQFYHPPTYAPQQYFVPQEAGYDYRLPMCASVQISPVSAGSVSSRFQSAVPVSLSPPDSPMSLKRPYDLVDVDTLSDDPDFQAFERDAMRAMAEKNGGALLGNNPRMRRAVRSNNSSTDDSYRKQRERNNHAAKQSRDKRKLREIHLALKATYLKKEVARLKAQLAERRCVRCQQSCLC